MLGGVKMWLLSLAAFVVSMVVGLLLIITALPLLLFDGVGGLIMALGFILCGSAVLYVSLRTLWRLGDK